MRRRGYRLLPHTADLRLEVRAETPAALFASSVTALFSLLTDRRRVRSAEARVLEVSGDDPEERLFRLLREALLLFAADRFLVRSARGTMNESGVRVEVRGEPFDAARHTAYREIKAVTAHGIAVEATPDGHVARFIVDV